MRSFGLTMVGAALLSVAQVGCGQPTAQGCPRAIGVFHGSYTKVDGTCNASFQGRALLLEQDDPGNTVRKVNNLSDSVITEITLIGCTIGMKQEIIDTSMRKVSEVEGDLSVRGGSALAGQITRREYMPDGSTLRCMGHYNATYTRDGATIGAAAEHALASQ